MKGGPSIRALLDLALEGDNDTKKGHHNSKNSSFSMKLIQIGLKSPFMQKNWAAR